MPEPSGQAGFRQPAVDQTPPVVWSMNATITWILTTTPAANILLRG